MKKKKNPVKFTLRISPFTCKSHSHCNIFNPGTTSANNIHNYSSFSSVQYSESYMTQSKWKGARKHNPSCSGSLPFNDERLIRVYFDRISTQARNSGSDLITEVHILHLDGSGLSCYRCKNTPLSY